MIAVGIIGLVAAAIVSYTVYSGLDRGALPAVSFLVLMIGIAFYFPTLLEEAKGEISTMRVVVFTIVMVFAVLYIKMGWNAGTFESFSIDKSWIYILGLAFGSKAFQKFGEKEKQEVETETKDTKLKASSETSPKGTES